MLSEILVHAPLDRAVEISDRGAALGAEHCLARSDELVPSLPVDPVLLTPADVTPQAVVPGSFAEALCDRDLLLSERSERIRNHPPSVADVQVTVLERSGSQSQ